VGSGSINPNSGVYDAGTVVTLTPVAVFPYVLDHWSGTDNDTINPTTVTMNADTSVTAHFRLLSPGLPNTANRPSVCVSVAIPIHLEAGQWLQAQFTSSHADPVNATDPNGTLLKDLGIVTVTNFTLQAQITGTYYVNCTNNDMIMCSGITLTYTIYS
ncbi:MAG: hypothetical protein NTZ04_02180, partial [Chloroflexi bacterium]|nr:hypothetical protein [Chloroflexota bacterium]